MPKFHLLVNIALNVFFKFKNALFEKKSCYGISGTSNLTSGINLLVHVDF